MTTLILIAVAFCVSCVLTIRAAWGDGRTDLRRCPRCWYDMSGTPNRLCTECGHEASRESQLHQRRTSKRRIRAGIAAMCLLALIGIYAAIPGPWTRKVPSPLLRLMLSVAANPPAPPAGGPGSGLPAPAAAFKFSRSPWERLVWQHQASIAFRAWDDAVHAAQGPISDAELARLVPLADDAHALFAETGSLIASEAFAYGSAIDRIVERRAAARDPDAALRAEWALSELQYQGSGYSWREDFARVPDAIITQALNHPDARVRLFGLDRFGRRAHQVVMEPASPMPVGREVVESIASGDPDGAVRRRAADLIVYMDAFLPKK